MCELNATKILGDEERRNEWIAYIRNEVKTVHTGTKYAVLHSKDLMGLLQVILVKEELQGAVREKICITVKLGFKGYLGNKGAILTRAQIYDSSFCFINCHLEANRGRVRARNKNIKDVSRSAKFYLGNGQIKSIFEHDIVIWAGDFNYRINNYSSDEIIRLLFTNNTPALFHEEQFIQERRKHKLLPDFTEPEIHFFPTFKYKINSDPLDFNKKRQPAWCDRILYKGDVAVDRYDSAHSITASDHKPVFGLSRVYVKICDRKRQENVKNEILRKLNELHQKTVPTLALSSTEITFQNLKYKVPQEQSLVVTNTGPVTFECGFSSEASLWLSISPRVFALEPQEAATISFSVLLTDHQVRRANSAPGFLNSTIILSLLGGSHTYVSSTQIDLHCPFQGSCFGASITQLTRLNAPILSLDSHISQQDQGVHCIVPNELLRMVTFLQAFGLHSKFLFVETGDSDVMAQVRKALDSGEDFAQGTDVFSMGSILLEFLEMLAEPLVPCNVLDEACRAMKTRGFRESNEEFFRQLPSESRRPLRYILNFLVSVANMSEFNGLTPAKLSVLFADPLTHIEELRAFSLHFPGPAVDPSLRHEYFAKLIEVDYFM